MSAEQKWTPMRVATDEHFPFDIRLVADDGVFAHFRRAAHSTRAQSLDDVRSGVGFDRDERPKIRALIADQEARIERIAACWNYLANIPTEKLDGTLLDRLMRVEAERDRLRRGLERAAHELELLYVFAINNGIPEAGAPPHVEARALIKDTTP